MEARGAAPAPGARETAGQAASGEAEASGPAAPLPAGPAAPGPDAVPPPGGDAGAAEAHDAPPAQGDASPQQPVRPRGEYAPSGAGGASVGESEPAHERAGGEDGPDGGAVRGHGVPLDGGAGPSGGGDGEAAVTGAEGPQDGEPAGDGASADEGVAAEDHNGTFTVRLDNFEGPFDLLLQLISKHKMDVTEVALSKVTDEFMAHIRAMGPDWDLDQTTEFLVVAATLLDLKAARLLPAAEVEDEADLALLEARDLLFARLLQYRAYKRIADIFNDRLIEEARRYPRTVGLEPHHAELLPDVVIRIGPEGFAKLAVKAMQAKPKPQVYVDHIHAPLVSVREQAEVVVGRLRELGEASFATLTADAPDTLTVVARFLALLELYRERAVLLEQPEALGALMVRWSGAEDGQRPLVTDEFDQEAQPQNAQAQEVRT
ncbi:segregation/condensation protein A [Streptomyces sp. NPDC005962]|uniref:segregation/condensation protein A n=1 Tax=Streptomyces sp. NPDC005962 TaxID=3154466 RepID=UPI00340A2A7E